MVNGSLQMVVIKPFQDISDELSTTNIMVYYNHLQATVNRAFKTTF